jgi:hypothetical protein
MLDREDGIVAPIRTSVFNYEAPKEKRSADWSGTIIQLSLSPLFFLFVYLGNAEMGFATVIVLGMIILAIKLRWKLRMHIWFWATIVLVLLLHVPLVLLVHWQQSNTPKIVWPLGFVDFLLISGALGLAEKLFSKRSAVGEDDQ